VSRRAAQPVPLGADITAGLRIAERFGGIRQPVGPTPLRQGALLENVHHSLDHGDQYPAGPPGNRGRRPGAGSGTSAGGRATVTIGFGFGAGFVRRRSAGRSGLDFGTGSGCGNTRRIMARVFRHQRQSLGVEAKMTGSAASG
jgi:hypothetical protein